MDAQKADIAHHLVQFLSAWQKTAAKLESGEITREEYDRGRYRYPEFDVDGGWARVPEKGLSDGMVGAFKKYLD